jgi:uncharacterized membrane protein (UPF0127 family)
VIRNLTQKTLISSKYSFKRGFGKVIGLLGRTEAETIVFETRFGIHTFFLRFPLDLIVLDDKKVVRLAKTVQPNRIVFWDIRFKTVIELPAGTLKKTHTKIGDFVSL